MPITVETVTYRKYGGIYYTDIVNYSDGAGELVCSKLVFTSDIALIDTRINEVFARHLRPEVVLIKDKL